MPASERDRADLLVIGGGFGGLLLALIADRIGWDVFIVERESHPRFAVGESSTPVANMVLRDLSDRYELPWLRPLSTYGPWRDTYPDVGVGRKRGFSYFHHRSGRPYEPRDDHAGELLVTANESDYAADTHWLRADVDAFLAERVREAGIPLLEETEVLRVGEAVGGTGSWAVGARGVEGALEIEADWIVEATGGRGPLQRSLGISRSRDQLRTRSSALFAHFRGVRRWEEILREQGGSTDDHPFRCDEAALHHVCDEGWMWVLRFADERVSAGFVLPDSLSPEEPIDWDTLLGRYPSIARQFEHATVVDPPGRIVRTGRLQHRARRIADAGWALLPSAAGFSGPVHSTGIGDALLGVERLGELFERLSSTRSRAADAASETDRRAYEQTVSRELEFVDALVALAHRALPSFRLFRSACLYYFAAVTRYERRRLAGESSAFLCADEPRLREALDAALRRIPWKGRPDEEAVDSFEAFTERALEPFDQVGLFEPPVPNMYPHTAPS